MHHIITIYDCYGAAIVAADRYVYSCLGVTLLAILTLHPIQPKQVDIWYNKSCEFYWSHPHVRTHLCAHANYPHPYNKTPNDKAYNMWSICGLGCVNGTIRKNDNGEMYKWFGIHITINFIAMWRWVDKPLINNIPMEDIWEIYHDNKLWKWICRNNNI